jgi:hypothetical protein
VDTTWVVYGARKRFAGDVIGIRAPWLFVDESVKRDGQQPPAAATATR